MNQFNVKIIGRSILNAMQLKRARREMLLLVQETQRKKQGRPHQATAPDDKASPTGIELLMIQRLVARDDERKVRWRR